MPAALVQISLTPEYVNFSQKLEREEDAYSVFHSDLQPFCAMWPSIMILLDTVKTYAVSRESSNLGPILLNKQLMVLKTYS